MMKALEISFRCTGAYSCVIGRNKMHKLFGLPRSSRDAKYVLALLGILSFGTAFAASWSTNNGTGYIAIDEVYSDSTYLMVKLKEVPSFCGTGNDNRRGKIAIGSSENAKFIASVALSAAMSGRKVQVLGDTCGSGTFNLYGITVSPAQ